MPVDVPKSGTGERSIKLKNQRKRSKKYAPSQNREDILYESLVVFKKLSSENQTYLTSLIRSAKIFEENVAVLNR